MPNEPLPLEAKGVVGVVRDASGRRISSGEVVLVPAADVAALAKKPIDLSLSPEATAALTHDEPLEDLLDTHAGKYQVAKLALDGQYRFSSLDAGSYFVVWRPDALDDAHLPGGSACRSALDRASLIGVQLDLKVSSRPSDEATYVGSTSCFACHGRHRTMGTAHRVGLSVPGARGAFQDTRAWPAFDSAVQAFDADTTLYYFDCDPSRPGDAACHVSATDPTLAAPSAVVSFEAHLTRNASVPKSELGAYTFELRNRLGAGSAKYDVALTYGGALYKQHFITRRRNANGSLSYFMLPLQFNTAGSDTRSSSDDWVFRDYRSADYYDLSNHTLRSPDNTRTFDANCAGCHLTGMQLSGDSNAGWSARAVADASGDLDYDGDGRREEINIGCESCHGPGSEHLESKQRGERIVSPSLLTPEREVMLCGRCHSRPRGVGGGGTEAPLSAAGRMPLPGLRRSQIAAEFTSRVDGEASDFHPSGDSSSNHQQYSDFVRSSMYRNSSVLMTCTSCHDAHGSEEHAHELEKAASDNSACTGCHSASEFTSVHEHVEERTSSSHDDVESKFLTCTGCHMVRTVASGARRPELLDRIPGSAAAVQYYHGDIASHRFEVVSREHHQEQPVAGTSECGVCHGTAFVNP